MTSDSLWEMPNEDKDDTYLAKLLVQVNNQFEVAAKNYWDLHRWSVENPGRFWSQVWDDGEFIGSKGADPDHYYRAGEDFISSAFFTDAKINVAENLLAKGSPEHIAIVSIREDGHREEISWAKLRIQVAATAAAMEAAGVVTGDRVVAWAPNIAEVMIYSLAALSIGAVTSTASPDFAASAVLDRFSQIEPKLLLAGPSYVYGGKSFHRDEVLKEIIEGLPSLIKTIVIGQSNIGVESFESWIEPFLGSAPHFQNLDFNHPGFVLFSSGTTGKPKCITHSAAGILLKDYSEQRYHLDIKPGDKVFFFTTCGWMMWNWLLYVLASGATIVLYDGSPVHPHSGRLIDLIDEEKLTFFGLSAKLIDTYSKEQLEISKTHDLSSLRTIGSTGSVLSPESFDFIYQDFKRDVHLVSMSGGTDICGCFLAGVPTLPVHRGELQAPCLGMAVAVFNSQGSKAAENQKGELVCTLPFPSKPLGFWGDVDNHKYRAAYFEGFPNVWTHGDFASQSGTGGFTLYGRSDATLNSKGVRIGTAEIYRVVESFLEITESMAVSQDWENDTRVLLFVTLKSGTVLTPELITAIKVALRTQASPRHVPDLIIATPELPRTKSNKLVELAVTDVINGRTVRNVDSLANPLALEWFKQFGNAEAGF